MRQEEHRLTLGNLKEKEVDTQGYSLEQVLRSGPKHMGHSEKDIEIVAINKMEDLTRAIRHGFVDEIHENAENAMNNVDNTYLKFGKLIGLLLSFQGMKWKLACRFLDFIFRNSIFFWYHEYLHYYGMDEQRNNICFCYLPYCVYFKATKPFDHTFLGLKCSLFNAGSTNSTRSRHWVSFVLQVHKEKIFPRTVRADVLFYFKPFLHFQSIQRIIELHLRIYLESQQIVYFVPSY